MAPSTPSSAERGRGFNELLSDAITPLPPIGSNETSLSTYWIDRATREVLRRRETGDDGPVQSGNATTLILSGSMVIATSDYEEVVQVADRAAVMARGRIVARLAGDEITTEALTEAAGG